MKKIASSVWQNNTFVAIVHLIDFSRFNTNIAFKEIYQI